MKSNYEERRARRIERLQNAAQKASENSSSLFARADKLASVIPFGQPILVGHHSERGDRTYRAKIHNAMDKGVQEQRKADHYSSRAQAAMNNNAISSDDPDAIDKLREKLQRLQDMQEIMKDTNKIIKSAKMNEAEKVATMVEKVGLTEKQAIELLKPDFCGRIGFPSYKLTNNNGNISRIKKRIESLEKVESMPHSEKEINGVRMVIDPDENRVQLFFPGKPSDEVRAQLKGAAFNWSPYVGAWIRKISNSATWSAEHILNSLNTTTN